MKSVEQKIIADYWLGKVKGKPILNEGRLTTVCTDTRYMAVQDLAYFNRLTAGNANTEFTVLLAVFNILTQRYFQRSEPVFSHALLYELPSIGGMTVREFLQATKETVQTVYKYADQDTELLEAYSLKDYASVGFFYNTEPEQAPLFPFSLHIRRHTDGGLGSFVRFSERFADPAIALHFLETFDRWIAQLQAFLPGYCARLPIISEAEKARLQYSHPLASAQSQTLTSLIEQQVSRTSENIALVCNGMSLTYAELNAQANQLANYLIQVHHIAAGDLVAVKLPRNEGLLISILAVLKTGAAYVPIDIHYPEQRIAFLEEDADCKLVIDQQVLDDCRDASLQQSNLPQPNPDSLAYIIYTSGTTGKPKGVMISHRNATALINWAQGEFDSAGFGIAYAATSHCFDLSIFEMFYPLSIGKQIRLLDSPIDIAHHLQYDRDILLNTVPSAMRQLLEQEQDLSHVRMINLAGEAFPVDIADRLLHYPIGIRNLYGPSEDTTYSTCYRLTPKSYETIPIGQPLPGTQVYILDAQGERLPTGLIGRLFISGAGLSQGYLNRPELTAEKFIPNPYDKDTRMYDTGDLARWLPDGNLAFHGRNDQQVKLRGFRIEPGEIENVMTRFSDRIIQVVIDIKSIHNDQTLVAWYTAHTPIDESALRQYLTTRLPLYMVPSHFIRLGSFPLNINGKIDRKAVRELAGSHKMKSGYIPAGNAEEATLVGIWEEVLGSGQIGIRDHFLELGGHSLMIAQIINRMHKRMGKGVSFKHFYANPTIEQLARILRNEGSTPIPPAAPSASYPATPSQRRLWLLSQLDGGLQAYQITGARQLKGALDVDLFMKAFDLLVQRHEILRTCFIINGQGELEQQIIPYAQLQYQVLTAEPGHTQVFDLSHAPLFQASLTKKAGELFLFSFSIHHILADGWSIEVLTHELLETYFRLRAGDDSQLPPLPIQFKDYAVWLAEEHRQTRFTASRQYWLTRFQDELPELQLPASRPRPLIKTFNGRQLSHTYPASFVQGLDHFARTHHFTLFAVLLSAFRLLLSRYSNQYDLCIGTPIAGREHPDLENQVGLYLNTLALRSILDPDDTFLGIVQQEQSSLLEAYAHQDFPFDALVDALDILRDVSRSPLFDVMLVLQNQQQLTRFSQSPSSGELTITACDDATQTSKFDLTLTFEQREGLNLSIEYNTDIYDEPFIRQLFVHLENILEQGTQTPDIPVRQIDILSKEEKQALLQLGSGMQFILYEDTQLLQPWGAIGELCVEASNFITGERIYRTGDLARWLPDGNLELIGRKDSQIRIRGNRVELGEIERWIGTYPTHFTHVLVDMRTVNGEKVLVVYYRTTDPLDKTALRSFLLDRLPVYMVPNYYIELPELPLTTNGEIDRKRLPEPTGVDIIRKRFVAPSSPTEKWIASIWQTILGQPLIGINDDFFELGGNSLLLVRLINEYKRDRDTGIELRALYNQTTLLQHARLLDAASVPKTPSASNPPMFTQTREPAFSRISKAPAQEWYDLSASQLRYWLIYNIQGRSREFNIYSNIELPADLDHNAFEYAFNALLERHEILRTVFADQNGTPKQKVLAHQHIPIPVFASTQQASAYVYDHTFDLDQPPLFRIAIAKSSKEYTLFFNIHHIASDGWSMGLISRDLMELYKARLADRIPELPILPLQYKDYAHWQRRLFMADAWTAQRTYWQDHLSGPLPYLQLPADYPTKIAKPEISLYYTAFLDNTGKQQLTALSRNNGLSLFAVFVAAFKILLNRLTAETDIIIGIPVANRDHFLLKDLAGCFINTLMLRDQLDIDASFLAFVQQINDTLINALSHQNYPFEQLLETLEYPVDNGRFPISPVFLNNLDFEANPTAQIHDFNSKHGELPSTPKFDLECYIQRYANGYSFHCVYDGELFKKETIAYWIDTFTVLLSQIADRPNKSIRQFDLFTRYLPSAEDPRPLHTFTQFQEEEILQSIPARFQQQVRQFPDRIAVFANDRSLTYNQLDKMTSHLAQKIMLAAGSTRDSVNAKGTSDKPMRIALLLEHDETCVIGMLGALKAGYAYVPIDINNPLPRTQYILTDSEAGILVCSPATLNKARQLQQALPALILITTSPDDRTVEPPDDRPAAQPDKNLTDPWQEIDPFSEAYVLYTSGSTGEPKGVRQNHRNILHFIRVYTNNIHIAPNDNLSLFSTYTFDASVKDIYGAILNGATVSLYDIRQWGLQPLSAWLHAQHITIIHMVPTIYRHFIKGLEEGETLSMIRLVDLGGEPCYRSDLDHFKTYFLPGALLVNDYGPTESTIVSQKFLSHHSVLSTNAIPLGKVVTDTEVFLLDETGNRMGIYQEGEIVFRSPYLSLGYLHRQELTDKVFSSDLHHPGYRLYRSGDIGRMLPNGEIQFVRRKDSQIKLNGQRIELAEIEYQLEKIDGVEEAVVMLREINGNMLLTAWLRKDATLLPAQLAEALRQVLPKNMIPAIFMHMDSFPLTRTGKIDRENLPQPIFADLKTAPHIAPQTGSELTLAAIWADILQLEPAQVGIDDNFFDLGGNSLLAIKLANRISRDLNVSIKVRDLFEHACIRQLNEWLQTADIAAGLHIPALPQADDYVLSSHQRRLWITCHQPENSIAYHIPGALLLEGPVDTAMLRDAYILLMTRHESLRTILVDQENDIPRQKILPAVNPDFEIREAAFDLTTEELDLLVNRESNLPFDLYDRPPVRVKVISFPENKHLLLVVMHHIISDGWSMDIFIREWIACYTGLQKDSLLPWTPLAIQYKDFSAWQQQYMASPAFDKTLHYWTQRLSGDLPVLNLPFLPTTTDKLNTQGELIGFTIPAELYEALKRLALTQQVSLFSLLFTSFNVLLSHACRQQRIILGTSVAGRRHPSLEPIIGFFVNTLAISTSIDTSMDFLQLLQQTSHDLLNDIEQQDMPFDELITHLDHNRIPGVNPVFQARFVLNNERDEAFAGLQDLNIRASVINPPVGMAKFSLSLVMHYGKHLSGTVEYRSAQFDKEVIQLIITAYTQLLEAIVQQPGQPVDQLDTFNKPYQQYLNRSKKTIQDSFLKKLQTLQKK